MPTAITSEWPVTRADQSPQAGLPRADTLPPGGTLAVMNVTFFHGDSHSLGPVERIRHHSMA